MRGGRSRPAWRPSCAPHGRSCPCPRRPCGPGFGAPTARPGRTRHPPWPPARSAPPLRCRRSRGPCAGPGGRRRGAGGGGRGSWGDSIARDMARLRDGAPAGWRTCGMARLSDSIRAMSSLALTLMYLLAAVLGVVACRSLKLPPMLGYLVAGVLIGPHALALAQNSEGVRHLGEFGVVFLMFAIGLEFSLPKLRAMRRQVFGLGLMQVVATMALVTGVALLLSHWIGGVWDMGWQTALALSGVMTMSSTAIVVKLMVERAELESG